MLNKTGFELPESVTDILDEYDISICSVTANENDSDEICTELEYYSPLGEDFLMTVWHGRDAIDFADKLSDCANDFDTEEHAAEWYDNRHRVSGVPQSLKDLLEDAEAIKDNFINASKKIYEVLLSKKGDR